MSCSDRLNNTCKPSYACCIPMCLADTVGAIATATALPATASLAIKSGVLAGGTASSCGLGALIFRCCEKKDANSDGNQTYTNIGGKASTAHTMD